jgi:aryl-alcohol dehydrogenase-like predicted oxidoreductase
MRESRPSLRSHYSHRGDGEFCIHQSLERDSEAHITQMQALHDVVKAGYVRYVGMSSCYAYQCAFPRPVNLLLKLVADILLRCAVSQMQSAY